MRPTLKLKRKLLSGHTLEGRFAEGQTIHVDVQDNRLVFAAR